MSVALLGVGYAGNIILVDWGQLSGGTSGFLQNSLTTSAAVCSKLQNNFLFAQII